MAGVSRSCWFTEKIGTYMRCWESPGDLPLVIEILFLFARFAPLNSRKDIQGLTPGEVQDILHLSRCLTLFLTPFYHVNICLLFVQFGALICEPYHRTKMLRNNIKQDIHFTTLKGFKIIKLTNLCQIYNKEKVTYYSYCQTMKHVTKKKNSETHNWVKSIISECQLMT